MIRYNVASFTILSCVVSMFIAGPPAASACEDEPLPAELQEVVRQAARSIRDIRDHPHRPWAGRRDTHPDDLTLAGHWPRAELRDALIYLLDGDMDRYPVDYVFGALTGYDDPVVDAAVGRFVDDERRVARGSLVTTIDKLAREVIEPAPAIDAFASAPGLLPPEAIEEVEGLAWANGHPRQMTVPVAIESLRNADLSIRLQAWLWLAGRHGIVLDPQPLADAWPQLSVPGQRGVARALRLYGRFRTGGERLVPFLSARLGQWEQLDRIVRTDLLVVGGRLHVPGTKQQAAALISRAAGHPAAATQPSDDLSVTEEELEDAFVAYAEQVVAEDLNALLAWAQSPDFMVRDGAAYALAGFSDWRAVYVVQGALANPQKRVTITNAVYGVAEFLPDNEEIRWSYIRCVSRLLAHEARPGQLRWKVSFADDYDLLLKGLTGYDVGWQLPSPGSIDMEALRQAAAKWERWIVEHDPATRKASP